MAVVGENHPTPITLDLKSPPVDVNAPLDARDIELVQQTFARQLGRLAWGVCRLENSKLLFFRLGGFQDSWNWETLSSFGFALSFPLLGRATGVSVFNGNRIRTPRRRAPKELL